MSKFVVMATWSDVPHLSKAQQDELWASIPPYQRDARSKGIPQLGSGVIYPIQEDEIICDPFTIPKTWPRAYGMDVGWNRSAVVWGAWDTDTDTIYLYQEHYRSGAEPAVHAEAVKSRGSWMWGVIDPSARGRSQTDGTKLIELYADLGLNLDFADNAVEAGLLATWERLSDGRLKVFSSLSNWRSEFRRYRRDEKGKIVKADDHLMDSTRYLIMSGGKVISTEPNLQPDHDRFYADMSRSAVTGY